MKQKNLKLFLSNCRQYTKTNLRSTVLSLCTDISSFNKLALENTVSIPLWILPIFDIPSCLHIIPNTFSI